MLSRKRKIPRKTFPYILSHNKKYNSKHFLLYLSVKPVEDKTSLSQFSFSVSKKVASLSTERNRIRRWGYEALNSEIKKIKPGYFLFFLFKKNKEPLSFNVILREIRGLLSDSGVII